VATMNDTLVDAALFVLASPILLFQAVRRVIERYRFFRLAMESEMSCECGATVSLVGYWLCSCGFPALRRRGDTEHANLDFLSLSRGTGQPRTTSMVAAANRARADRGGDEGRVSRRAHRLCKALETRAVSPEFLSPTRRVHGPGQHIPHRWLGGHMKI
jgi:hypothetical protein